MCSCALAADRRRRPGDGADRHRSAVGSCDGGVGAVACGAVARRRGADRPRVSRRPGAGTLRVRRRRARPARCPSGRDNVRLRAYATTEGEAGNVGAGALTSLLSAVPVSEARNPLPASGGAGVEPLDRALQRAPALLRHRRLALTEADVEAIACEASPAVVRARAHGARDRWGRPQAGAVRVVVVARDGTDRPEPTSAVLRTREAGRHRRLAGRRPGHGRRPRRTGPSAWRSP